MTPQNKRLMEEMLTGPIIGGRLDTDWYKMTMGPYIHAHHPHTRTRWRMTNRTKDVRLAEVISERELQETIEEVRRQTFKPAELQYLQKQLTQCGHKDPSQYIHDLGKSMLPPVSVGVGKDGQFDIGTEGTWFESTQWEIPNLAIVNELRTRAILKGMTSEERNDLLTRGQQRLHEKIAAIRALKNARLTFCDFGTRRRAARVWQRYVDKTCAEELGDQFLGTSNVENARDFDLYPKGTTAHELPMVEAALSSIYGDDALRADQLIVSQRWWELYGQELSIALPDTYGSDFFLRNFLTEWARKWHGFRHDSGDPFKFGEKIIRFYQSRGIDPRTKIIVFSDGLDLLTMLRLFQYFNGVIGITFGWGTLLTNDLGIKPISIVQKVTQVWTPEEGWVDAVKLSDNRGKNMGDTPKVVDHYKHVFDYHTLNNDICIV